MKITENEVGKEYLEVLSEMIEIRKHRKKIYGDSFLYTKLDSLLSIINGKLERVDSIEDINHPKFTDELLDIANYCLFVVANLRENKKCI
jgi:hypothetical protein